LRAGFCVATLIAQQPKQQEPEMTATQQTKTVQQILAGLLVKVRSDVCGSMITGHADELLRAQYKLQAAGFDCHLTPRLLMAAL
jgi:hypothetical protein